MGQVGANYPHRRRRLHQARPHRSALRSRTAGSAEPQSPASTTVAKFETQDLSVGPTRATEVCSADVTATNAAVAAERRTPVRRPLPAHSDPPPTLFCAWTGRSALGVGQAQASVRCTSSCPRHSSSSSRLEQRLDRLRLARSRISAFARDGPRLPDHGGGVTVQKHTSLDNLSLMWRVL